MSRKPRRRVKQKSPEQIAAEKRALDFQAVGLSAAASALAQHGAIEVIRAGEKRGDQVVDADVARRLDAFEALKPSMKKAPFVGAYDAARRLERDITISMGLHDGGRPERVDCDHARHGRLDRMIEATERVVAVRRALGDRDWWLLNELIRPTREWRSWREAVAHVSGETHTHAQGAAVRSACVNLRDAYQASENRAAA